MKEYMIIVTLPEVFSPRFMSLINDQRKAVSELMNEGVILNYSLSHDRSKLWITLMAESETEVKKHIKRLPLSRYMQSTIVELMFHQSSSFILPEPSLN